MSDDRLDGAFPLRFLLSDRQFYDDDPHDVCSRCGQTIAEDVVPVLVWPAEGEWMLRYHPVCLGFEPHDDSEADA